LIDYSQEARAYALVVLLITLSALALHRATRGAGRGAIAGFAISALLAAYTHFIAFFWVVPAMLILLIERSRARHAGGQRDAIIACAAIAVAIIPELLRTYQYATQNYAFHWLEQPDPAEFVRMVATSWFASPWAAMSIAGLALLLAVSVVRRRMLGTWARANRGAAMILAALVLQPIALWLFGYGLAPIIMPRTILPSLVGAGLLIAVLVTVRPVRWSTQAGVAVIGITLVITLASALPRRKEHWPMARAALGHADAKLDLIIVCPMWKAPPLMAATRDMRAAPLATPSNGGLQLIEQSLGADPAWDQLYFRRVFRPVQASALGLATPAMRQLAVPVRDLYVVTSECVDKEEAAIARWAGPHRVVHRWTSPPIAAQSGIMIERWTLARPRRVTLRAAL
jgi:hypothetical protein